MERFKIDLFQREHPGVQFPAYRSLSDEEARHLRERVAAKLGLDRGIDGLALVKHIAARGVVTSPQRRNDGSVDLAGTFRNIGLSPPQLVYLNWYRFDRVDEMRFVELASHLEDIHLEGVDDLDILDASVSWIVSVTHDRDVQLVTLPAM